MGNASIFVDTGRDENGFYILKSGGQTGRSLNELASRLGVETSQLVLRPESYPAHADSASTDRRLPHGVIDYFGVEDARDPQHRALLILVQKAYAALSRLRSHLEKETLPITLSSDGEMIRLEKQGSAYLLQLTLTTASVDEALSRDNEVAAECPGHRECEPSGFLP
jgi:hypothetical protein